MPLAEVVATCRDETGKFLRRAESDDAFCLELFRRAVCERSDAAWEAIMAQYRSLVVAWVRQQRVALALAESDDYWVNRVFERFWRAVGADRFDRFEGLSALLKYLKLCAHSVLLDEARARAARGGDSLDDVAAGASRRRAAVPLAPDVEDIAVGELSAGELWQAIEAELADDVEQLVAYHSFVRGLKPREIYERYPEQIGSVADVHRIKRNVIERLRRSPQIRRFLD